MLRTIAISCLVVAAAADGTSNTRPCDGQAAANFPWCDTTKSIDARVASLVSGLTDAEKAGLLVNGAAAIPRINWPQYNWWSEALHGVARNGVATSFPQICGVAASLNRTLWHGVGDVTSTEGRGKNNDVQSNGGGMYHGLTFWAPNVNIFRDPRWGRGEETPGEDPTLNGDYAEQFVTGMQSLAPFGGSTSIKVSACLKHYAAYNEEAGRNSFAAMVTSQDMEDTFLPAFQAGVEKGNATSIMCSYNAESYGEGIYGSGTQGGAIPSCANKGILNDLTRKEWGFDGYITSDCGAVGNVENQHKYTNTTLETVTAVLTAGMDTDCGGFMSSKAMAPLLVDPSVSALVTNALTNLFKVQFRLGFANPAGDLPWNKIGQESVNTPAHQALAKEAADQSLVLLKNDQTTLPVHPKPGMKIAVLGRNADATNNMQGNYFGTAPFLVSPAAGIAKHGTVVNDTCSKGAASCVSKVAGQDLIVIVSGLTSEGSEPADEAEGHDRTSLLLPDGQDDTIKQIVAAAVAAKIPVVMVTMGGGPVDISAEKANAGIGAIMWCGYPGQSGGDAIADAIFGKTNPSGRLTLTWYPESLTKQVPITDMHMRPNKTSGNPGRTYRFYTGTPVFKFGEGLSYSSYTHVISAPSTIRVDSLSTDELTSDPTRALSVLSKQIAATVAVETTNTGKRDGAEAIMIFAASPNAGQDGHPIKSLVAFDKVHVARGASITTTLSIEAQHFTETDIYGYRTFAPGDWKIWINVDGEDTQSTVITVV